MNQEQLKALARALNQPETTDPAKLIEMAQSAFQLSTANAAKITEQTTALQTANAAKADIETQLTTANSQVQTLTTDLDSIKTANSKLVGERDTLQTANAALTTERDDFRKGLLDLAEKTGAITPAERTAFDGKLTTANSRAGTITEIIGEAGKPARKAMNTLAIEIDGKRHDLSTANARTAIVNDAISAVMTAEKCDYTAAYAKVKADPKYAQVFAAMADPTKAAA